MESYFKGFTVEYIERNKNTEAGDLAKAAKAHGYQYHQRGRLESSVNGIPSPLL
jgi:hypothetical protein